MAEDENGDEYRITLAQQIFGKAAALSGRNPPAPKSNEAPDMQAVAARHSVHHVSASATGDREQIEVIILPRQLKTAAELAEMIELDLARHPDCPKQGFRVTVYGGSHWRAMLTIAPAAGGVRNPGEWRDLTNDLAERLSKRYELTRE